MVFLQCLLLAKRMKVPPLFSPNPSSLDISGLGQLRHLCREEEPPSSSTRLGGEIEPAGLSVKRREWLGRTAAGPWAFSAVGSN
uniref:Uncharacterized protein n=1 Tax=Globodera rostochiensis TaxID=31243 RepID=A0A914IDM6_GLORO